MTTRTQKTDRDRLFEEPEPRVQFLFDVFEGNRESSFMDGLKAFANQWFNDYEDEQNLPAAWHNLVSLAEDLGFDVSELTGDNDEDEDDD